MSPSPRSNHEHPALVPSVRRVRAWRALLLPATLFAAVGGVAGCSVLYDLSTSQCSTNEDCAVFGEGILCVSNVCQEPEITGCATHAECMARPDISGETACIKSEGRPRGECIELKNTDCPTLLPVGDVPRTLLESADPVILGAFNRTNLSAHLLNVDLAVTEFNLTNGGIPTDSDADHPVIMVVCDGFRNNAPDAEWTAHLDRSMQHLSDVLHVPAIASSLEADDLKYVFESKGAAAEIFFMSSQDSESSLLALDDPQDLMWHVMPGGRALGRAYRPVIDRVIQHLQLTGEVRIAMVTASDNRLLADLNTGALAAPEDGGIVFNGKSALENLPNAFLPLSVTSNADDVSEEVDRLLTFKPHIIISLGLDEFTSGVLPAIETLWETRVTDGQPRPFYVLSPLQLNFAQMEFAPEVRERAIGLNAPAAEDRSVYTEYLGAWVAKYPEYAAETYYENFYDSAYYLLYAAAAADPNFGGGGRAIARGMARLIDLDAEPHKVGTTDMAETLRDLRVLETIRLNGTMGPPNFSPLTGGREDVASVWCIDTSMSVSMDVLRYESGTMQGTFPCFENF